MKIGQRWSEAEDAVLRAAYGRRPTVQLARELGQTERAVRQRAKNIGAAARRNAVHGETLCWSCARPGTAAPCSWDENFTPVAGWTAHQTPNGGLRVDACPLYEEWKR